MARIDSSSGIPVTLINATDWQIWHLSDVTANQNSKVITVPAGYEYQVLFIFVEYISDANAGNRQIVVDIRDAADAVIGRVVAGATQAASLTRRYMFAPSLADLGAFRNTTFLMTPFPPTVFLPPLYDLRVYDTAGISAGDDFTLQVHVARREL